MNCSQSQIRKTTTKMSRLPDMYTRQCHPICLKIRVRYQDLQSWLRRRGQAEELRKE